MLKSFCVRLFAFTMLATFMPFGRAAAATNVLNWLPAGYRAPALGPRIVDGPRATFVRLFAQRSAATLTASHFNFPYAVATDGAGDVYVTNAAGNSVLKIDQSTLQVDPSFKLTHGLADPVSLAVDTAGDIYAGNYNGGVLKFDASGVYTSTAVTNAGNPFGIVTDDFQDLFIIATTGGVAVDDATGASIFNSMYTGGSKLYSVTVGGPEVYAFSADAAALGNGSVALRKGLFTLLVTGLGSKEPVGSACITRYCWWGDALNKTISFGKMGGTFSQLAISYAPAGIAYDGLHGRLFVADPVHNAIQLYNASTLAFVKTIQ
jgi:hypothetical protein